MAQLEYAKMVEMPEGSGEREKLRGALLKYCERDTWAMVVILGKLVKELDI